MLNLKSIFFCSSILIFIACGSSHKPSQIIDENTSVIKNTQKDFQDIELYTASSAFEEIHNGDLRMQAGINFLTDKDSLGFFFIEYDEIKKELKLKNLISISLKDANSKKYTKGAYTVTLLENQSDKYSDFNLQVENLVNKEKLNKTIQIPKPNSRKGGVQYYKSMERDNSFIKLYHCSLRVGNMNGATKNTDIFNFVYTMYNQNEYQTILETINGFWFINSLLYDTQDYLDVSTGLENSKPQGIRNDDSDFVGMPFKAYQ